MINRHQFQQSAKKFRGGRITLAEFTEMVFAESKDESASPAADESSDEKRALGREMGLHLRVRPSEAHKGDFGRVLAIGGSAGMLSLIHI